MSDAEFRAALRNIITTSSTEDEVMRRVAAELGRSISITSYMPTDQVGCEASEIASAFGGLRLRSGAMVMVVANGPSGAVIQL